MSKLFDELRQMKEEYDRKIKQDGQTALKEAFKELFEQFSEIRSIVWSQYTPYFNDGDTCEFSVHDFDVNLLSTQADRDKIAAVRQEMQEAVARGEYSAAALLKKKADKLEERLGSDTDDYQYGETLYALRRSDNPRDCQIAKAVKDFSAELPEDVLEAVFGDHVLIVATPQGFTVSEKEHD